MCSSDLVGIVSSYNEIVPGHMNLDKIVDAVKQGVAMAGGTPIGKKCGNPPSVSAARFHQGWASW